MKLDRENGLSLKRVVITAAGVAICLGLSWYCLRIGFARTLAEVATLADDPDTADLAVAWSPADAETHFTRGEVLGHTASLQEAVAELDRAVQLRPRDYYVWLELGLAREQTGDQEGALRALRQSVALAPAYANTHWQLGNFLLRAGRNDEAFAEFRRAVLSNPALIPNVSDLAWGIYGADPAAIERVVTPRSSSERMSLAIFYARHGASQAALKQFVSAGVGSKQQTQMLLDLLIEAKAFGEAYQVWARLHGDSTSAEGALGKIQNGSFEDTLLVGDSGFGWQIANAPENVVMSMDDGIHQTGVRSLRVEFHGNSNPQTPYITQLVLVRPEAHYRLVFSSRAQQIVSAALPMVTVSDPSDKANVVLGQSSQLSADANDWRESAIDFATGPHTSAVSINVLRQACKDNPCPAFGTVWLDSFTLQQSVPTR
jgi:tetratricopeptide (TPR) repeat protein